MHFKPVQIPFSLFCLISSAFATPDQSRPHNANHIFNAIHSSMRQWGSSLNHNGMSFFLATVPAGTQLYHGTWKQEAIEGTEWLAFEPEHSLIFARPRYGPPSREGDAPPRYGGGRREGDMVYDCEDDLRLLDHPKLKYGSRLVSHNHDKPGSKPNRPFNPEHRGFVPAPHHPHDPPPCHEQASPPSPLERRPQPPKHQELPPPPSPPSRERKRNSQQPLGTQNSKQDSAHGYLHTYVPFHSLRLLYIDGLSAGKTSNGTLDTQDLLLLNLTDSGGPMGGEFDRAGGLCNLTSSLWEGKIDGILRMEAGFEIILCDFDKHLERADVIAVTERGGHGGPGGLLGGWPYIKAVASRYHAIGGERATIDYDAFVSVFAYPDVEDLFINDVQSDYPMPRLQNVQDSELLRIKNDVTNMILHQDREEGREKRDWQAVADMVVQRYSEPLHYLHTNEQIRKDKDALATYLLMLLLPFIDITGRNATLETRRCVSQFIPRLPTPPRPAPSLAHRTLHTVTHRICDNLLTSLSIASSSTPHSSFILVHAAQALGIIDKLVEYLQWTTWKECGTCEDEEVCFIPIWPMGSHQDHAKPRCLGEEAARGRTGYWGFRQGPPREGEPPRKGEREMG